MTWEEYLFICSLDELKHRIESLNDYNAVKASALLRQLLLEGRTLLDMVNKEHRLKITFTTSRANEAIFKLKPIFYYDGITPNDRLPSDDLNLNQFLSKIAVIHGDETFTVKNLISACANKLGGVHVDIDETKDKDLLILLNHFYIQRGSSIYKSIGDISEVVLNALQPLVDVITKRNVRDGDSNPSFNL